jgi:hypothetical protein
MHLYCGNVGLHNLPVQNLHSNATKYAEQFSCGTQHDSAGVTARVCESHKITSDWLLNSFQYQNLNNLCVTVCF